MDNDLVYKSRDCWLPFLKMFSESGFAGMLTDVWYDTVCILYKVAHKISNEKLTGVEKRR